MALTVKSGDLNTMVFDVPDLDNAKDHDKSAQRADDNAIDSGMEDIDQVVVAPPIGAGSTTIDPTTGLPLPTLPAYVGMASVVTVGVVQADCGGDGLGSAGPPSAGYVSFAPTVIALANDGVALAETMRVHKELRNGQWIDLSSLLVDDVIVFVGPNGATYEAVLSGAPALIGDVWSVFCNFKYLGTTHVTDDDVVNMGVALAADGAAVPAPTSDDDDPVFDPSASTEIEVMEYIEMLGDPEDPDVIAETQRVVDDERAQLNRPNLVGWLDARLGVI